MPGETAVAAGAVGDLDGADEHACGQVAGFDMQMGEVVRVPKGFAGVDGDAFSLAGGNTAIFKSFYAAHDQFGIGLAEAYG